MDEPVVAPSRRSFLHGTSLALATGLAGCVDGLTPGESPEGDPIEVTVKTLPADEDPPAVDIGRRLTEHLNEVGVDASLEPKASSELFSDILIEHDFDMFVANFPGMTDPDALRPLVHSAFEDERGWQNPFGVDDAELDHLLEQQMMTDHQDRRPHLNTLQHRLLEVHPFSVVAIPDELTGVGDHLQVPYRIRGLQSPFDIIRLGTGTDERRSTYRIGILDGRITLDHNPLTPVFPLQRLVSGLLYDSLFVHVNDTYVPWLTAEHRWERFEPAPTVEVTLREGHAWHDGTPVRADDVAFTYRFISDLARGTAEAPIPAPRYRARSSVIESVTAVDDATVHIEFAGVGRTVAIRALTVPILQRARWKERDRLEDGLPVALTTRNPDPIGSGPFVFEQAQQQSSLALTRNGEHFLEDDAPLSPRGRPFDAVGIDRLEFRMPTRPPTIGSALNQVREGDLDVIARLPAHQAATVTRSDAVHLEGRPTHKFYMVGFNLRDEPGSNRAFRRLVGRLLDRTFVVALVFRGYARAADSPLASTRYLAPELAWSGQSQLGSFPGSSGLLDVEAARELFLEADFRLEDGEVYLPIGD